jgi:hypothetical protein
MTQNISTRRVRVGFVAAALMAFALPASAQTQEVQPRVVTRQAATKQVAVDPLGEWGAEYAKALEAAQQLQSSSRTRELGEQLELDLAAYDEALREYVRVSERLRHRDRALTATAASMDLNNQMQSRTYQTLSNALRAAHDAENASIRNMK